MSTKPSIGVMFRRERRPGSLADWAHSVERAGFDELWVVEDLAFMGGISQAAVALDSTARLRVGLGVAPAMVRTATYLAMELATLAEMYPERLHAGIGHGVPGWMEQVGARPASWLQALTETTSVVRSLLAGEQLDFHGDYITVQGVRLERPPESVPLVSLGVRGPKSLALAGRVANETILAELSAPAYVTWARQCIERGLGSSDVEGSHRLTAYAICDVDEDAPENARQAVRRAVADALRSGDFDAQIHPVSYADDLRSMIRTTEPSELAGALPAEWINDLAIAGSTNEAHAARERLYAAGADSVVLVPPVEAHPDEWLRRVSSLAVN